MQKSTSNVYIEQPIPTFPLSPKDGAREIAVNPDTQAITAASQPVYRRAATYQCGTWQSWHMTLVTKQIQFPMWWWYNLRMEKNQGANQRWLKVTRTHFQMVWPELGSSVSKEKPHGTQLLSMSWCSSSGWCFLTEDGVASSSSAVFEQSKKLPTFLHSPPPSAISLFAEPKYNGLSCCTVCFSLSDSSVLPEEYESLAGIHAEELTLEHRPVFPRESLLYLNTEAAPWWWTEDETTYKWLSVAENRKDKRPLDWHHTARKFVIKGHSLIAVTAKECWHEQEYSSQGTCSFVSCSYILAPSSFFFRLHYFFTSWISCSFSRVILLLCTACLPSVFLTVQLLPLWGWVCLPFFLLVSLPYLSLPCKPRTNEWTEGPQKPPVKFNRTHRSILKIWNGPVLRVGASWRTQIWSDDISRVLKWMAWAPPQSICYYFINRLCPFPSARHRPLSKAVITSSYASLWCYQTENTGYTRCSCCIPLVTRSCHTRGREFFTMQKREHEDHLQAMSKSPSVKATSLSQ